MRGDLKPQLKRKAHMPDSTIHLKGETYEVYNTSNPMIRALNDRFLRAVSRELRSFGADGLLGLDLGCGEGHMLSALKEEGSIGRIVAVDLDMERLTHASECYAVADFVLTDATELPFPDGSFDYVLAAEILEHLPQAGKAMREITRVCRNGASLIVTVPFEPFFHLGNLLRGKHLRRGGWTPAHVNRWTRSEARRFLERHVEVIGETAIATFPWLLYSARKS